MAGSYIKQFPELKSAINAEIKLAEKDKDFLEIKLSLADLNKIKNKFNISNNVLLSDAIKILKKLDLFVNIGKSNYDHKILAFILKDKNVILYVHNVNKLNKIGNNKKSVVLKARVPAPNNVKALGPVNYTTKNPFTFPSYFAYPPTQAPVANGNKSIVNKGAIFWYNATAIGNNIILGIKYILVNTPSTSFVPNPTTGVVTLSGADFYYGFPNKTNAAYTDFYIFQLTFNNYLYVFTVKNSQFFTSTNFPSTKNIAIASS